MICEALYTLTGLDERAISLMQNRDGGGGFGRVGVEVGGLRCFKCFKFSKTVTSLWRAAKINPLIRKEEKKKEKNGACLHSRLFPESMQRSFLDMTLNVLFFMYHEFLFVGM